MATTEPTAPLPETAPDPIEGTPPAATPVPAEATPPSPAPTVDWENRYRATQAELTRQQMARAQAERERDALRMDQAEPDDEETPARRSPRNSEASVEWKRRAEAAEWQIAESVHGPAAMAAYRKAQELQASATTPSDVLTSYRVFAQELARSEAPAPPPPPAPAPVAPAAVDSNRSDGPLLTEVDQKLREAAAAKDLRGWLRASLSRG